MQARTTMKKVDIDSLVAREYLDRSFNRSGLCAYCSRKIMCVISHENGLVFDCDDYDPGEESIPIVPFTSLGLDYVEEEETLYGLCAQCQKKDVCQLKNISGGIWHCDEYV
ncbi:MAG: hypothetical protein PHI68_02180 [Candidatus Cloacimonetes bacterium]|nr:hypothetical protein [Candidatus Cloacimonadota bacterium]